MLAKTFGIALCGFMVLAQTAGAAPILSPGDPALTGAYIETFESQPDVSFTTVTIGTVTISGVGGGLRFSGDANGRFVPPMDRFLDNKDGATSIQFDFLSDVSAFGLQIGATNQSQTLSAYDSHGSLIESIAIPNQVGTLPYPHTGFYGIAAGSDVISYATLTAGADWIVLDDLTYKSDTAPVPIPGAALLLGSGLTGLLGWSRRKKK